ncbi:hypothetical protein BJY16_006051 [Actinoplanes octamycinicus]|uniref:Uncharacterized protein n=1 Tax=Actinoplanes octamycinicus TaxID=135948 RepID=A0A7W7MA47_9ACTN|nr:hypothetical protein [Actinoplanes octamycinicus]MBB4742592.1 hypothetical protein [Actinoplanes octamycinicus]GIE60930.1 hypothetical protein Aoc01nite_63320 [Actinoplanes octamycinicus]
MPTPTAPSEWVTATRAAITASILLAATTTGLALAITLDAPAKAITLTHLTAGLLTLATIGATIAWRRAGHTTADLFGYALPHLGGPDNQRALITGALLRTLGALALLANVLTTRTSTHRLIAGLAQPLDRYEPNSPNDGMLPHLEAWNATQWDPDLQSEIEHRRRQQTP